MSRRFGRNQRRKMREEIATHAMLLRQSQASLASESEARLKEKRKRLELAGDLQEWARRIADLLGTDSAFARKLIEKGVDPSLFRAIVEMGNPMRGEIPRPLLPFAPDDPIPVNMAAKLIDLFSIHASIDRDQIAFRRRFLIRGPQGARALMMDERTLYNLCMSGNNELARHLLHELVAPFMAGKGRA